MSERISDDAEWVKRASKSSIAGELSARQDRIAELETEVARLKVPDLCSVCCGQPLPSGRKCICDGGGTAFAEMHGLRVGLMAAEAKVARVEEILTESDNVKFGEAWKDTAGYIIPRIRTALQEPEHE